MSAFVVSKEHIDLLVTAAVGYEYAVTEDADQIGRMLWAENVKSVQYRYRGDDPDDLPGPIDFKPKDTEEYRFELIPGTADPAVIERAAASYQYQSCEHPGWSVSAASHLVGRIRDRAEREKSPHRERWGPLSYDFLIAEAWGVDHHDVFFRALAERVRTREAVGHG